MKKLNSLQQAHVNGKLDVYASIEAHTEEWVHNVDKDGNYINAFPKPNTRRRQDLPSLAEQWREDAKRRSKHGKSTSNR